MEKQEGDMPRMRRRLLIGTFAAAMSLVVSLAHAEDINHTIICEKRDLNVTIDRVAVKGSGPYDLTVKITVVCSRNFVIPDPWGRHSPSLGVTNVWRGELKRKEEFDPTGSDMTVTVKGTDGEVTSKPKRI
jgi:hypothetical protein